MNERRTALMTGINEQDRPYLAELLIDKSHKVPGLIRRASVFKTRGIDNLSQEARDPEVRDLVQSASAHLGLDREKEVRSDTLYVRSTAGDNEIGIHPRWLRI